MKGFAVTVELPVLWGDMDALRHVNNTRYFAWFEAARITYFDRVRGAFGNATSGLGEIGPILATTSCDYLRPVTYPANVLVGVRVGEIGNSSVRMEYELVRADAEGDVCARGASVIVLVRYATLEKVRVPDDVRQAIAAIEDGATD
jgi:acyl-CoA thioester hydrolase